MPIIDPFTGATVQYNPTTHNMDFIYPSGAVESVAPYASGEGYLSGGSWLDKLVSWVGKAASAFVGGGASGGSVPGIAPYESMPKISINKPPELLEPYMLDIGALGPGPVADGLGEGSVDGGATGAGGLMPWVVVAAVVLGLLFFLKSK